MPSTNPGSPRANASLNPTAPSGSPAPLTSSTASASPAMQQLNFKLLNDISWVKPNPLPNLSCRYFTHATETIIWAAKDKKSRHTFNYKLMKETNRGKQMKSVWEIKPPEKWEKKFGKHPTQKPVALLERILLASTNEGDVVLDPFSGSGTTVLAALRTKRMGVGIEIEEKYIQMTRKRLGCEEQEPESLTLDEEPTL